MTNNDQPTMDFADTINALSSHFVIDSWMIKGLVAHPDLTKCGRQETEMSLLPIEFVDQRGGGDFGFYGDIYFPTKYSDGDGGVLYLHVTYSD